MDAPKCQNFPSCGKRHYGECGVKQEPRPKRAARKKTNRPAKAGAVHFVEPGEPVEGVVSTLTDRELIREALARIESLEERVKVLEGRKRYQRDLMRKRRAEGKA